MQSMLATAMLAKSHTAYTHGLLCTGCFYQQLCGHIKDLKAVWCIRQGRLHSVQLFTGTFKHYGKKVPHLPLDIHSEIKLNSSAVTRLSWGPHNISQQLKVFWYWQTDMTLSSRGKKSSGKAQAVGLYVGMYFSWNPLLETYRPWHWSQHRAFAAMYCHQIAANRLHHVAHLWLSANVCSFLTQCQNHNQTQNKEEAFLSDVARIHFLRRYLWTTKA